MNIDFGKLREGNLIFAPNAISGIVNPADDIYLANGWKKIIYTPMPEDAPEGQEYVLDAYTETATQIFRNWKLVDIVVPLKEYSKYEICLAIKEYDQTNSTDLFQQFMDMINSDPEIKFFWDASESLEEGNVFLEQGIQMAKDQLGITDEQIQHILDRAQI